MADVQPEVVSTDTSWDVIYSDDLTVVVPKTVARTKAAAIKYSEARYNEYKENQSKQEKEE